MYTVIFFYMLMEGSVPYVNTFLGCTIDKQAIRQDDQEKEFLQQSAQIYWDGVRWGIPAKSAIYYEHPLVRSRWENNPQTPYNRVTEVKILHIEVQESSKKSSDLQNPNTVVKTATVYVFIEGIGSDNTLQSKEIQQSWYRNTSGWFVSVEE